MLKAVKRLSLGLATSDSAFGKASSLLFEPSFEPSGEDNRAMGRKRQFITPERPLISSPEFFQHGHRYTITINNDKFETEKRKSELINLLLDLYYEKYDEMLTRNEIITEHLSEIRDFVEREHHHKWAYIDKGNFIDGAGCLYRFVCVICGDYKRIEEDDLDAGINRIVDESIDEEPARLPPPYPRLSSVMKYKSNSIYD